MTDRLPWFELTPGEEAVQVTEVFSQQTVELPRLESGSLRTALADPAVRCAFAPYSASLLAHPRAKWPEALALDFVNKASLLTLSSGLGTALRGAGLHSEITREALISETQQLAVVLAGLADDFAPWVRLATVEPGSFLPEPPASVASARLALLYVFDPSGDKSQRPGSAVIRQEGREITVELPACTAIVLKLDPDTRVRCVLSGAGSGLLLAAVSEREPGWIGGSGEDWLRLAEPEPVNVLLVSMPFGPVVQPSLALGLLKSALPAGTARVLYLSLALARRIGRPLYQWINGRLPFATAMAGEWLFRSALYPEIPEDPHDYLADVALEPTRLWLADETEEYSSQFLVPEGLVADLLWIRRLTDDYLDWCVEEVLAYQPKIVGLTSVFEQHVASLALARRLKARSPSTRVVLGGANCEGVMGLALLRMFDFVDAVVSGEGEVALPELANRWLAGKSIDDLQGVFTRSSPEVVRGAKSVPNAVSPRTMDDLPYPDFDDFFSQMDQCGFVQGAESRLQFETSRGCWWGEKMHCTFCSLNGTGMAFRSKSAKRALDELHWLIRRYGKGRISTVDNILDMQYFKTFLPSLAEEQLDLDLFYEVKANLKKDQIRLLRRAGVLSLQAGVESLSDQVLRLMGKGVTGLQNIVLLKWCAELEVWPVWNLLWGFPGESPEEYERMVKMVPWLHHLPPPTAVSPIFLERFSPNYFRSEELGFANVEPMRAYRHIYPSAGRDLEDLAFFFDYDYRDGRDVAQYVGPLISRVFEWRDAFAECTLSAIDSGRHLVIYDTRPAAVESLTFLDGQARDLYLACDEITSIGQLAKGLGADRNTIERLLGPLLDKRLLLRQGDRVLGLA
ncbi:MAG TPA: RiPP maturation radical SAM C-methyltransferase, partial [Thermoanaerobaculia bacterium]|nr:RiPP maturation radical SAM C-methyltransferase [Thermoanaerobaculia bacterium]